MAATGVDDVSQWRSPRCCVLISCASKLAAAEVAILNEIYGQQPLLDRRAAEDFQCAFLCWPCRPAAPSAGRWCWGAISVGIYGVSMTLGHGSGEGLCRSSGVPVPLTRRHWPGVRAVPQGRSPEALTRHGLDFSLVYIIYIMRSCEMREVASGGSYRSRMRSRVSG